MAYGNQEATRAAIAQAEKAKTEVARLRNAIAQHYRQIHQHNWGVDDELWAAIDLVADPDIIG